jgi:hypothetical protein
MFILDLDFFPIPDSGSRGQKGTGCGIWSIFMPMICSVQLLPNRDGKAAAEEDSLQIVSKNCNNILFYCLVHRRAQ